MRRFGVLSFAVISVTGCTDEIDLDPYDDAPAIEARVRPKPITGGTLTLVGDQIAIAGDPDRDRVFVVDLVEGELMYEVELEPGDEPGRIVTSHDTLAHVVLRGAGDVLTIDIDSGEIVWRTEVCPDPRGLAHDAGVLHVACADGSLKQLDLADGGVLATVTLEPDLRDVFVYGGDVHVSRFRAADILDVDGARTALLADSSETVPRVAWRTWVQPDLDSVVMLHQRATLEEVPIDLDVASPGSRSVPYGGGGGCSPGIMSPVLTLLTREHDQTFALGNAGVVVDAAISREGWFALAVPGADPDDSTVQVRPLGSFGCDPDDSAIDVADLGQFTSVAFTSEDALVMLSREPARIVVAQHVHADDFTIIDLPGESRFDTGHEIFHRVTESSLSCASCHPEGMDDGHVWAFEGIGKRRTQSLEIGIEGTAPFHWDGDMADLDILMSEVLAHRMGGSRQSVDRADSFARWLFAQERPKADAKRDDATLVETGAALFVDYGCAKCHFGDKLGGASFEVFDGKRLQVPSLRRVSLRPPFMHDGRAKTLEAAVLEMIHGTNDGDLPKSHLDAITAYVRTL